jgi:RNA-binding protein YlmH
MTLLDYMVGVGIERDRAVTVIAKGLVRLNGEPATDPDTHVVHGDAVAIHLGAPRESM